MLLPGQTWPTKSPYDATPSKESAQHYSGWRPALARHRLADILLPGSACLDPRPSKIVTLILFFPQLHRPLQLTGKKLHCLNLGSYNYLGFAASDEYCTPKVLHCLDTMGWASCSSRSDAGGSSPPPGPFWSAVRGRAIQAASYI
jgi:hypothetical protein